MNNDTTSTVDGEKTQNIAKETDASGLSSQGLASLLDSAIPELSGETQAGTSELVSDTGEIQSEGESAEGLNTLSDVAESTGEDVISEVDSGTEPESDSDDSEEDEVEASLPKGIKKRISKLAAKKREAEERLRKAEQEIEELRQKAEQPRIPLKKEDNPFENISKEEELQKAADRARQVRDWCEENPYGGTITRSDGTEVEIDEREARRMKVQAMRDLEVNIPSQHQKIQARKQFDPIAEQQYPWWKKKESAEYKTAQALLQNFPELAKFPDYKLVVGDFIFGMSARQARTAKNSNQVNKAPIQPSRPSASPVSRTQTKQTAMEAESRFNKTKSRDDLASLIEARYFG